MSIVNQAIQTSILNAPTGTQTVSLVVVDAAFPYSNFDSLVQTLTLGATTASGNLVVAVAGTPLTTIPASPKIVPRQIQSQPMTNDSYNQQIIAAYVQPQALSGILIILFLLFILITAFLGIMSVQTPTVFVSESIDWGKIEK